jgi:dipeptidyl aminopeptidase/acylaminoacyl peptidase
VIARPPPPIAWLVPSPSGRAVAFAGTAIQGPIPHDLFVLDATGVHDRSAALDRAVLEARWQDEATVVVRTATGFRTALYRLRADEPPSPIELPCSARAFDVARDGTVAFVGVGFDRLPELYVKPPNGAARPLGRIQDASWDRVALVAPEIFRFTSFDGSRIEAALFKPARTAPRPRDPLVLLVHGGPNSSFSADYFWFNAWPQLLVARGYQVLLVNPRGSTGYGEAFVKADRGDLGGGDYRDLMTAVDQVLARGETDPARLGIGGWSYGGEMTAWAIGHTERFKAAVVGAGVFDQAAEFGTENGVAGDEWQFGTPWNNPDVFARNSPSTFIGHARTPVLIVHGDADRNNPIGQSQALYRALKYLGVETELVVYPGEPHLPRRANHQRDILERMLRWFDGHLGPAAADPKR